MDSNNNSFAFVVFWWAQSVIWVTIYIIVIELLAICKPEGLLYELCVKIGALITFFILAIWKQF